MARSPGTPDGCERIAYTVIHREDAAFSDVYGGGNNIANNASLQITVIPEPGTALLMGLGLAGLATTRRKA